MNLIKSFNDTIDYIETVLNDEIDEKQVAHLSGYSFAMFSRLFPILADMTLSEYIRNRRLSEAAILLRETDKKIIDIAMKYGYKSSDSFTTAFKKFHGYTPSDVKKGKAFKIVSPVQLAMSVTGGRSMNVKIERKGSMIVAGVDKKSISPSFCSSVWGELYDICTHEELAALGDGMSVGVSHDSSNPSEINYLAGYIIEDIEIAKSKGLDILSIAEAEYAMIELEGIVPDCIHKGWKYALEVFLPEHGYIHSGAPDFEYYYEADMMSPDYKMELWVPIKKA